MESRYSRFRTCYYIGMFAGAGLTIIAFVRAFVYGELTSPYLPTWIGIPHVIVLAALSYGLPPESRVKAGNQLGTAGYLHTLVGFSVLLTLLGLSKDFSPQLVLGPLGSALITSLVGWFFGGELVGSGVASDDDELRSEAARVISELRGFSTGVRTVHEEYFKAVKGLISDHEELDRAHRETFKKAIDLSSALNEDIGKIGTSLKRFEATVTKAGKVVSDGFGDDFNKRVSQTAANLKAVNEELLKVAEGAKDSSIYLRESRLLIDELSKIADMLGAGDRI